MVEDDSEQLRQDISIAIDAADSVEIAKLLSGIGVAQTALLLDSLPSQQRDSLWPLIEPTEMGEVLLETQDDVETVQNFVST